MSLKISRIEIIWNEIMVQNDNKTNYSHSESCQVLLTRRYTNVIVGA